MTIHGDLYYEGKEFEIRLKEKKPGDLSDDLRTALGMPVGPVSSNFVCFKTSTNVFYSTISTTANLKKKISVIT